MGISKNRLTTSETLKLLSKPYLKTSDIKKIASCGDNKAIEIKKAILKICDERNYYVPSGLTPTEIVIEYLNININYLKKMMKIERELNETKIN